MRALELRHGILRLNRQAPRPEGGADEVRIRIRFAGICGTDLELLRGYMEFEGILGHEFVGVVEEDGEGELVDERVVSEINCSCGVCRYCRESLSNHCPDRKVIGIDRHPGAFADYIVVPRENVHRVPAAIPDPVASMIEPFAAALKAIDDAALEPGYRLAILGDGRLGLMVAMAAEHFRIPDTLIGRHPEKMSILKETGIRILSLAEQSVGELHASFDRVIDCTGRPNGLKLALELVRPRGRIVMKTTVAGESRLPLASLVINEIGLIGSRCGNFESAIGLLEERCIPLERMVTGSFELEAWEEAFDRASRPDGLKVLFRIEGADRSDR